MLPKEVQDAFYNTFVYGADRPSSRTTAAEWMNILKETLHNSHSCAKDKNHLIYSGRECPYCKASEELMSIAKKANENLMKINNTPAMVNKPAAIMPIANNTPIFHSASSYNNGNVALHKQSYLHNTAPYLAFCLLSSFICSAFLSNLSVYIIDMFGYLDGQAKDPLHIFLAIIFGIVYYVKTEDEYEQYGPRRWCMFIPPIVVGFFSQQIFTIIVFLLVIALIVGIIAIFEGFS